MSEKLSYRKAGVDMSRGAFVTTGRLNAEMVVKALRRSVPVLASRSAVSFGRVCLPTGG
jgi:formate dehydrogenase assembly factor FdhD